MKSVIILVVGKNISSVVITSIGANKSVTLDYAVQVDGGGNGYASSDTSAGFFLAQI